jgi:hypothetical protein
VQGRVPVSTSIPSESSLPTPQHLRDPAAVHLGGYTHERKTISHLARAKGN